MLKKFVVLLAIIFNLTINSFAAESVSATLTKLEDATFVIYYPKDKP